MTFQYGTAERNAALDAMETSIGASPTLELRTGAPPANCAAADTGSVLATLSLPADWMANASGGSKALLGTWQANASAAGRAGHFRLKASGGTARIQGLVSDAWASGRTLAVGDQVHNGGNLYRVTAAGAGVTANAPVHASGTVAGGDGYSFLFVQTGTDMTVDNASLNISQQVTVSSFTLTASGA